MTTRTIVTGAVIGMGLMVLPAVGVARAGLPTDRVRATTDQVLKILSDPTLKPKAKMRERRALLRRVVTERFDFTEMTKRSLGTHWAQRTPEERREFVDLFTDLLERSYSDKLEAYTDEKILYVGETIDGEYAAVRTKVLTKRNIEVPLDYHLLREGSDWKIYDVIIEGVSLINNYRTQFNKIIRANSYAELVRRMRVKQETGQAVEGLEGGSKPKAY